MIPQKGDCGFATGIRAGYLIESIVLRLTGFHLNALGPVTDATELDSE
jgi:hypothetical protein